MNGWFQRKTGFVQGGQRGCCIERVVVAGNVQLNVAVADHILAFFLYVQVESYAAAGIVVNSTDPIEIFHVFAVGQGG